MHRVIHAVLPSGRRGWRLPLCALALLAASGCTSLEPTALDGHDDRLAQPGVRAVINFDGEGDPAEPHAGTALEMGLRHFHFGNTQSLTTGQNPVVVNGVSFPAPAELRDDFSFTYFDAAMRVRAFDQSGIGLEWLVGGSAAGVDMRVSTPTQQASDSYLSPMLHTGLGLIVKLSPRDSVHLRGIYDFSPAEGVTGIQKWALYYSRVLSSHWSLHLGYTDWQVQGYVANNASDFNLYMAGPSLTLVGNTGPNR